MMLTHSFVVVFAALVQVPPSGARVDAQTAPLVHTQHTPPTKDAPTRAPTPFQDAQKGGGAPQGDALRGGPHGAPGSTSGPGAAPNGAPSSATNVPAPNADGKPAPEPLLEPWTGTLAAGLAEVQRLVEAKDAAGAQVLCERLVAPTAALRWKERSLAAGGVQRTLARVAEPVLDLLGAEALSAPARGEVQFASGLAAASTGDGRAADGAFSSALALAGPGELRLASGYQLATVALLEAEMARLAIPEVQQKLAAANGAPPAQPPAPAASAQPGDPAAPDPIQVARGAYLRARERYVERLRADWKDADARANTELVLKRLKELDELEKQREEKKKQDQQKNQDPKQQNDSKDPKDQEQKDPKKDQDSKPKDGQENQDPKDPKPDEPKEPEKREDPKDKKDAQKQDGEPQPKPGEERELSKEEMTRLLDVLKQREQQWKKLQQQLHQARRAKVKKDW